MYEYRKDVFDYMWILVIIYAYRFIVSRLRGEAHVISTGEDTPEPERPEKKLPRLNPVIAACVCKAGTS